MGANSNIAWTHHTFNPWWGCTKVSDACRNCYAERDARRFGHPELWGTSAPRRFFGEEHWQQPLLWNRKAEKAGTHVRVFAGSMCDIFEDLSVLANPRDRLFRLIEQTPWLTWLLLTKRPQNIAGMLPRPWPNEPRRNVWLLATAGDQEEADRNVGALIKVPAVVRGVSCEPLLGEVDLSPWLCQECIDFTAAEYQKCPNNRIQWIIVGGESGPHARPMKRAWVRYLLEQALDAGIPFFFKHWGEHNAKGERVGKAAAGDVFDGVRFQQVPDGVMP